MWSREQTSDSQDSVFNFMFACLYLSVCLLCEIPQIINFRNPPVGKEFHQEPTIAAFVVFNLLLQLSSGIFSGISSRSRSIGSVVVASNQGHRGLDCALATSATARHGEPYHAVVGRQEAGAADRCFCR